MNYYDLLKQYISTGARLNKHQFNVVIKNGSLLGSYLYARGKNIYNYKSYLSNYEYDYLNKNPNLFVRLGKDALVQLIRNSVRIMDDWDNFLKNISNAIFGYYYDVLTSEDIDLLVQEIYDPELFGRLYRDKPELFKSSSTEYRLLVMGVIGESDFDITKPRVVKFETDMVDVFFKNDIDDWLGDFLYEFGYGMNWGNVLRRHANDENIRLICKLIGIGGYLKCTADNVVSYLERYDIGYVIEEIVDSANMVCQGLYEEDVFRAMAKALSYYGRVLNIDVEYFYIEMDLSELKIDWAANKLSLDKVIIKYLRDLPKSMKPRFVKPEVENTKADWDLFNVYLSNGLKS